MAQSLTIRQVSYSLEFTVTNAEVVCSIALLIVIYTYIVYPVLIGILAGLFGSGNRQENLEDRSITIVIAALNEEASIERRISELSQLLTSSPFRGEIIVVSDGSTDETVVRAGSSRAIGCMSSSCRRSSAKPLP